MRNTCTGSNSGMKAYHIKYWMEYARKSAAAEEVAEEEDTKTTIDPEEE